jgi:hypothetical protein
MPVIGSVSELLARASSRTEVRPGDGKGVARYERVLAGGERYFVKQLSPASDWIMRVAGDHVHRPYLIWRSGMMARVPGCIDHTVVAMQVSGSGDDTVLTMVMRELGHLLVPEGDTVVPPGLARLVREHWSVEAHHHVRDVTFAEDTATSRTGRGPANLATIRAAVIAAIKDAGYLHVPQGRRDHTTPAEALRLD